MWSKIENSSKLNKLDRRAESASLNYSIWLEMEKESPFKNHKRYEAECEAEKKEGYDPLTEFEIRYNGCF